MPLTITEALAEIKTIEKRISSKQEHVLTFLYRSDALRDPLANEGGSTTAVLRERQSIADLEQRIIQLRRGIQRANDETMVTINDRPRPISEWLIWRREISGNSSLFLDRLRKKIAEARTFAQKQGVTVVQPGGQPEKATDILVSISEGELAREIEKAADTLGKLDGFLSLKNATTFITEE